METIKARPSRKPVSPFWYALTPERMNVIRFAEIHVKPYAVGDIWLVRGSRMDVAVDTGSGIVAPAPIIESIASKPVLAVALTCSYDHAGGWHSFKQRACHQLDAETLEDPTTNAAEVFDYLTDDMFSAIPRAGSSTAEYRQTGAKPTRVLDDGEILDLGDRELHVLHTPGRSPGGLSLFEPDTGNLFSGEILYDGEHGTAWPPSNPSAYCASLRRLLALPVVTVFAGHYGSFDAGRMRQLIEEQLADLRA